MTNYTKWDKFDVDSALEETDRNARNEDFHKSLRNKAKSSIEEQAKEQKKQKDTTEKIVLQLAVDELLKANKQPGYYRHYKEVCESCKATGLCNHRPSGNKNMPPLQQQLKPKDNEEEQGEEYNKHENKEVVVEEEQQTYTNVVQTEVYAGCTRDLGRIDITEARVNDEHLYDPNSVPDRMIALSNSMADLIQLVQMLHQLSESGDFHQAYSKGLKAIQLIDKIESFLRLCISMPVDHSDFIRSAALVKSIRLVTIALTSQVAYAIYEFAAAAELARCAIKLKEDEVSSSDIENVALWAIRGASYALMGNIYLARLHFQQCKLLNATFPNISDIVIYFDELEVSTYASFLTPSSEMDHKISWRTRLKTNITYAIKLLISTTELKFSKSNRHKFLLIPIDLEALKYLLDNCQFLGATLSLSFKKLKTLIPHRYYYRCK